MSDTNTLVTDKLVQILYNFLNEKKFGGPSAPVTKKTREKVVDPKCVDAPQILGELNHS